MLFQQPTPPPECGDEDAPFPAARPQHHTDEHDWTEDLPQTDHVRFFRETDWSKSEVGPLKDWSPTLRLFTRMLFADSRAACIYWGPNFIAIYNEAYMPLSAAAHPKLMGAPFRSGYPEIWANIKPLFDTAAKTGIATDNSSTTPLMVDRRGWREEAFFTGNFVPIGGGPMNQPEGFYNSLFEITDQRLAERRTAMLNRMASVPNHTSDEVCAHILSTVSTLGYDIPLAMLYEVDECSGSTIMRLRGHIGLPEGHNLIVDGVPISSSEGLIPDCRRAGSKSLTIDYDERFDSVSWQGFGAPSKKIAILPITSGGRLFGYMIAGTNPCRPFDAACKQFTRDLRRMVSSNIAAAVNAEESSKRQQQLENDLAFSDTKLRHLIEHASVGMVHISVEGDMLWANEHYYALSGRPADQQTEKLQFLDVYADEDRAKADEVWNSLIKGANHVTAELKVKRLYSPPVGDAEPAHIQVLAFPYREHGKVKSVMACTTDISRLKWSQNYQARMATEAREAKRQQEAFIDVVSHEMRNPLSAIVHCADEISKSLEECHAKLAQIPRPCLDALADNVSSANVIMQCANHQKRIIDDVLTLSKLDSMLLSITPSAVRPVKLVNSIVGIFEAEFKSNSIRYDVVPDRSFARLNVEYLYLDPSRVTQIFINLMTNAIKFVKASRDPSISIRYGACLSDPRQFFPKDMFWADKYDEHHDMTADAEWGTGEEVYLTCLVQDSGIGMKEKEILKVFERFRQANKRTHVKYGGSGLGLFISKELTEKQGGQIGVCSDLGEGSTFGFYIKTRRVERRSQTLVELFNDRGAATATQPLHVLLVEDNVINQQVLRKQLKKAGCIVEVANHGQEALDLLGEKKLDVVLMDLEMPVMDGVTAMKEIRKRQTQGRLVDRLPIIAVTANVRQEQIDTAIAAGADRVMQKPFKTADLVFMMQDLLLQTVKPPFAEPTTPDLSEYTFNATLFKDRSPNVS